MKTELSIQDFFVTYTLHDSNLYSTKINWDGSISFEIQFDEVWNQEDSQKIKAVRFNEVYEIVEFKIDQVNIIGTVDYVEIEDYNPDFLQYRKSQGSVYIVDFKFVSGGNFTMICADSISIIL